MPILHDFALPKAIGDLEFPSATTDAFFVVFLASKDPQTNKAWCPDVVAAMPTLEATFSGENKPQAAFIDVGQRPEYDRRSSRRKTPLTTLYRWKDPNNVFRTVWKVNNVPAVIRFEKTGEGVKEVGRLIEGEILDEQRLASLVAPSSK
jgi:hypothetical protein